MSEPMSDERLPGIRILLAGANFDRALLAEVDRLRAQFQRVVDLIGPDSDIRAALDGDR